MHTIRLIIQKETLQVLRDKRMLLMIFLPPLMQLLILAQAMTYEVKRTELVLADADRSQAATALVQAFTASGRFVIVHQTLDPGAADEALLTRSAQAILRIPEGFERDLRRGQPPTLQLVLNAEDGAAAGVIQGYASQVIAQYARTEAHRLSPPPQMVAAGTPPQPITIRTRKLYNAEGRYLAFMAIGLLASLVTIVGILLASQNIAREKEIGTLEQLNVTPITRGQFILGKLIPFWILGLIELTVGLAVIRVVFDVPFLGNPAWVYVGAAVYLLAALGLGLLVSTVATTQQQAQFVTFFVLVTFFFLGGIFTPTQSMPGWAQTLAEFNPIKHFVIILRGVLMKGMTLGEILYPLGAMSLFATASLSLALLRYRKTA